VAESQVIMSWHFSGSPNGAIPDDDKKPQSDLLKIVKDACASAQGQQQGAKLRTMHFKGILRSVLRKVQGKEPQL
jgi:hypothetical protein